MPKPSSGGISFGLPMDWRMPPAFSTSSSRIPGDPNESPMPLRADVVQVALDYQSGVLITVELVSGTQSLFDLDPASQYQLMVADTPGAQTTGLLGALR
jgi:hypothetical protein